MKLNYKNPPIWGITHREDGRFIIIDTTTGDVLHDGQYGFKSYQSAYNFGYNQYRTEPINCIEGNPAEPKVIEYTLF